MFGFGAGDEDGGSDAEGEAVELLFAGDVLDGLVGGAALDALRRRTLRLGEDARRDRRGAGRGRYRGGGAGGVGVAAGLIARTDSSRRFGCGAASGARRVRISRSCMLMGRAGSGVEQDPGLRGWKMGMMLPSGSVTEIIFSRSFCWRIFAAEDASAALSRFGGVKVMLALGPRADGNDLDLFARCAGEVETIEMGGVGVGEPGAG